ncbi:MAG: TrbI F-type domain-containing protein [Hyphomonadaceae bacterium]|jgi:hypothetical protein|nr:TrbI F-type domain-containing protein [Aquidulcibacter sp.]
MDDQKVSDVVSASAPPAAAATQPGLNRKSKPALLSESNRNLLFTAVLGLSVLSNVGLWIRMNQGVAGGQIYTVSANDLTQQFIAEIGRSTLDPEGVRTATRVFMEGAQKATEEVAGPKGIVLVKEAVLTGPAHDITPLVREKMVASAANVAAAARAASPQTPSGSLTGLLPPTPPSAAAMPANPAVAAPVAVAAQGGAAQ